MAKITPDQLSAAESVLRKYFPDEKVSLGAMFMEAYDAYLAAAPQKRTKLTRGATRLPDDIPNDEQRNRAIASWTEVGRRDLSLKIADIVQAFRAYHLARGTLMESWSHAWATWYQRQPEFHKPSGSPVLVISAFEDTTENGWLNRLEAFAGKTDLPRGTWRASWGPPPKTDGCKVPESVKVRYTEIYPPRTPKAG